MKTPKHPKLPHPVRPGRGSTSDRPIMVLFDVIGQRWTLRILWELHRQPDSTFRALQGHCEGMSSSVLSRRLVLLRGAQLATSDAQGYRLTPQGEELVAHLLPLHRWSEEWAAGPAGPIEGTASEPTRRSS